MRSTDAEAVHGPMLVCTATALEAQACALAFAQVPQAGARFEVLQTGMGMAAAQRALRLRLAGGRRPWAVVSTGLAGSVRRDIAVGTWVMATQVIAQDGVPIALSDGLGRLWHQAGIACRAQTFRTVDAITLQTDPVAPHATVVDMETYAWAEVAAQHRLPCAALRVISDTPDQPLPTFVSALTALTQTAMLSQKATHLCEVFWDVLRAPQGAVAIWRHSQSLARAITDTWRKIASVPEQEASRARDGAWRPCRFS